MSILDEFAGDAPKQSKDSGLEAPRTKASVLDEFLPQVEVSSRVEQPAREQRPVGDFSFGETLERGTRTLGANIAEAVGAQDVAEEIRSESPEASIPSFRQVEGLGTAGQFIAERTLESAPNIGLSLLGAGLGTLVAPGPGTAVGFALGAGTPLLGEARREIREEGAEGTALQALPSATFNTALEALPIAKIAKILGVGRVFNKTAQEAVSESRDLLERVGSAAGDIGSLAAQEGVVEVSQELSNKLAAKFFADKEVLALNDADQEQLKEAFFGGLAGGTGAGATAKGIGKGLEALDETLTARKQQRVRKAVESGVQDLITKKKAELERNQGVLDSAADRFDVGDDFRVFGGLQGQSRASGQVGPLPVDGTGPGASIFGFHVPSGAADFAQRFDNLDILVEDGSGGQSVVKMSQVPRGDATRVDVLSG